MTGSVTHLVGIPTTACVVALCPSLLSPSYPPPLSIGDGTRHACPDELMPCESRLGRHVTMYCTIVYVLEKGFKVSESTE